MLGGEEKVRMGPVRACACAAHRRAAHRTAQIQRALSLLVRTVIGAAQHTARQYMHIEKVAGGAGGPVHVQLAGGAVAVHIVSLCGLCAIELNILPCAGGPRALRPSEHAGGPRALCPRQLLRIASVYAPAS